MVIDYVSCLVKNHSFGHVVMIPPQIIAFPHTSCLVTVTTALRLTPLYLKETQALELLETSEISSEMCFITGEYQQGAKAG